MNEGSSSAKKRNRSTSKAPKLRPRRVPKAKPAEFEVEEPVPVISPSLTVASVSLSSTSSNGAIEFFYKPHRLTSLFVLLGYLLKVAFFEESVTRFSVLK